MIEQKGLGPDSWKTGTVERKAILVCGNVQGVGYRKFTAFHAVNLNLGGFCRNLISGEVEIEIEGPAGRISELVERLRHGPPRGRVDRLTVLPIPPKNETEFRVLLEQEPT